MKTLLLTISLLFTVQSFATGLETFKIVLEQTEVSDLEAKLADQGFRLVKVVDKYAEQGVRPRCICESFELTFKKDYSNPKTITYSVITSGYGNNMVVRISKGTK